MKHERRPYNHVLERRLEELPGVDADHLWNGMHAILDKKMPEKKERRRFIAWILNDRGLFVLGVALLVTATGFFLYFLSPNKNSSIANSTHNFSHSKQQNKSDDHTPTLTSKTIESEISVNSNKKTDDQIAGPSRDVATNESSSVYTSERTSVNYAVNNEPGQPTQSAHVGRADEKIQETNVEPDEVLIDPVYQSDSYITSADFSIASQPGPNKEQEKDSLTQQPTKSQSQTIKTNNQRGLYAGIVSGMDLSSVHFQSARTGASQGLILGYAFNSRWSLESGVLWDKKRFYDDGTYFNPPGYTPSSSVQIVAVNGTNRIYEWPLNIRYTIIPAKHSLFVAAGLSSYFMKSEHYDYEYVQNNQPGGHNYINYTNATKNWFSVLNFSLGYSHKLGSVGSLRIEPYFKLPIKSLGVANMPVMSTGLNIGFTIPLTR